MLRQKNESVNLQGNIPFYILKIRKKSLKFGV